MNGPQIDISQKLAFWKRGAVAPHPEVPSLHRTVAGPAGSWDGGGIASPGAAVADDGSVLLGYAAENSPAGGNNRGIGLAIAAHPLGPIRSNNHMFGNRVHISVLTGREEGEESSCTHHLNSIDSLCQK